MKIQYLILFACLLHSTTVFAKSKYWVKFGKKTKELRLVKPGFVNLNCDECSAIKLLDNIISVSQKESSNKNPYSVACNKKDGKVRIGKLYSGHSQSFCFMGDKSFISTNILKIK